ncbi:hypothetical protein AB0E69_11415 [Kribbella sp. NPDC026611]|uniref:hypothetical protein n=1 Tax=Kribbella sp. NPDC026611 TaxID=3154911 RepID=UPI0033C7851A
MAGFVQIIEYRTSKPDEIEALMTEFSAKRGADAEGAAPARGILCADRDESGRYFAIVEFNSYEEAMENSQRADTTEFSERMMELCDGPGKFYNLDLVQTMEYS